MTLPEARKRIWLIDSKGLVTRERAQELADHKLPWAHAGAPPGCVDVLSAVRALRPSALIGVRRHLLSYRSGSALRSEEGEGLFNRDVVSAMAQINKRPLIFALSRPIQNSECTPDEVYRWSEGRAVYASGCQHPAATLPDGRTLRPLNSTSCYIFPGVGLGAVMSGAERLRDETFLAAAEALWPLRSTNRMTGQPVIAARSAVEPEQPPGATRAPSNRPITPLGSSSVTPMNRAPSANSQNSGSALVNQVFPKFTSSAPRIAPTSVPRPPTATQITASIELAGENSLGLMMPTCGT